MKNNTNIDKRERLDYLDVAKGIGIIAVIIGHMGLSHVNQFVFTFHMPLFFLIAGYFISDKYDFKTFFVKKVKQLIPPYILTCIIICILSVISDIIQGNYNVLLHNLGQWVYASLYGAGTNHMKPFYIKQIGAIWFLLAMLWGTCIVVYLKNVKYGAIFIIALAYVGYKTTNYLWLPLSIQAGMTASIFIYIGYIAKKENILNKNIAMGIKIIMLLIWCFCIKYGGRLSMVKNLYENGLLNIIGAICAVYIIIDFSKWFSKFGYPSKVTRFYGRNSLAILCFHLIELNMFPWYHVENYCMIKGLNPYIIKSIIIILKILWSTVLVLLVNRISLFRKIFNPYEIQYKKNNLC